MRKQRDDTTGRIWHGSRLVVPVVAATGGAGRSTVSEALARALGPYLGSLAVADCGARGSSPWVHRITAPAGGGLACLRAGWNRLDEGTPGLLAAAASRLAGQEAVHVYTDTTPATAAGPTASVSGGTAGVPPILAFPPRPDVWRTLLHTYHGVVVDTPFSVTTDVLYAAQRGRPSDLARWFACEADVVGVIAATADARSANALLEAVTALEAAALSADRFVVALTHMAPGPAPRRVRSRLALLDGRVGAVVELPFDAGLHGGNGLGGARESEAAHRALAGAVLARTSAPLGPAPAPVLV